MSAVRRIPYAGSVHDEREIAAVTEVLSSGPQALRIGKNVREFERQVAALFGKQRGIMCNSGSSALYLAVELLGLSPGDEVITSAVTFSTDVAPLVRSGLVPAFVDVEPDTYNIDVTRVAEMIGPRTGAILVPNLIGNAPDWDVLRTIADEHGLAVVEDSCDALGSTLRGTPTGTRSDISVTSFALSHIITAAGTGGMVCLDDDELADRCLLLRRWGRRSEVQLFGSQKGSGSRFFSSIDGDLEYDNLFIFDEMGWNFEPSELSAAFGLVQLQKLQDNLGRRKRNFERLSGVLLAAPRGVRGATDDAEARHGLAHVPGHDSVRVRGAAFRVPAAHGEARHRHAHGLDRECHPTAGLPRRPVPAAGRRAAERGRGHGARPGAAIEPRSGRRRHRLHLGDRRGVPVMSTAIASDRLVIISADGHAGGNHDQYRDYLESKYLDQFDAWRAAYTNPFKDLTSGTRNRNWDDTRRLAELEEDGVVAEVIFPNTIPPFFPTGIVVSRPPMPAEYELRLAGIRAHNRWLADWCAGQADRRAGIGQIFLNDLDDAITDVRWCHEHGLRGGVLVGPVPDDMKHLKPLYAPDYDPLWAVCEELGVVVNTHSGGGGMPDYGPYDAAGVLWLAELTFFSRRPLAQMIVGGAFERFPRLRFVLTEQGASWIKPMLAQLDSYHAQMKKHGRIGELKYDPDQVLPRKPSEYFAQNCWVGVSFPVTR